MERCTFIGAEFDVEVFELLNDARERNGLIIRIAPCGADSGDGRAVGVRSSSVRKETSATGHLKAIF